MPGCAVLTRTIFRNDWVAAGVATVLLATPDMLQAYPIVLDGSAWYATLGLSALIVLAVLTVLSVRVALTRAGVAAAAR
jgi:hypothetical protein